MNSWEETRIGVIGSVDSGKCFGINTIIKVDKTTYDYSGYKTWNENNR